MRLGRIGDARQQGAIAYDRERPRLLIDCTRCLNGCIDERLDGRLVYGNRLKGGGDSPSGLEFKTLKVALFGIGGHFPDVLWDGYSDPKFTDKTLPPQDRICLQDVSGVVNADGPNGYKHPSTDIKPFQCTLDKLPAVTLNPEPKL